MAHKRRSFFVLPLVVLVFAILGGVYGPRIQVAAAASAAEAEESSLNADVQSVAKLYAVLQENAAEPVNPDKAIYKGAIPGMLRILDPHSNFFDPKEYAMLRDEQRGSYYGIGMTVQPFKNKTRVVAPFPGSPAYKAGLRPGDVIETVNDKSTEGLTTTEVADMLKGPRGTAVKVVVSRDDDKQKGGEGFLTFNLIRDEINRKSVPDGFFVQPGIAYIKILSFGETTPRELDENLKRLAGDGNLRGLVLDLRANPGGLLNAGVAVADHFLQKGQLIVSHRGRASAEHPFFARSGNHGQDYPIVVLVDRLSASAAEIVSGALQDHDRALILGETTFGKGLVQTVYPLQYSTALALTTAHFYTPSGRLIQRDYANQSFYSYYYRRGESTRNMQDVKQTDSGRTVYGGGGITPDVKYEAAKLDKLQIDLARTALYSFTRTYFKEHPAQLPAGWLPDAKVMSELHDYLQKNGTTFDEAQFTKDKDWIQRYLAREMYIYAFDVDASDRVFAKTDPEVRKAVESMPQAATLVHNAEKVLVQRMGR